MAMKRKAGGRPFGHDEPRKPVDEGSKLRINTFEDVADSEDEFYINRDKILLEEGPAQKRQRKAKEEEEFLELSDEEVLAASEGVSESDEDFEDATETSKPSHVRAKNTKFGKALQDSDSEASAAAEEDEDAGGWGTSRKDYYNADAIETEADALEEEAEARRLQQKQLQGMTEADFGFDEVDWLDTGKNGEDEDDDGHGRVIREVLPKVEITDAMGPEERLKLLRTRYPEFEPLAKEFLDLRMMHEDLRTLVTTAMAVKQHKNAESNDSADADVPDIQIATVKYSALCAYLASLSIYFAILTSGPTGSDGKITAMPSEDLRDHAIMETLVQSRDLWQKVKEVVLPESGASSKDDFQLHSGHVTSDLNTLTSSAGGKKARKESEENAKQEKKRKTKAQKAAEAAQAEAEARRVERLKKTEEGLADLLALTTPSRPLLRPPKAPSPKVKAHEDSDSDFGEQTILTPREAAEKAKRKKNLRFYTSQIVQTTNKRDAAGRDAGGDADLPYRERLKDRQARLNAEAEKRGKKTREPLGGSSDEEDLAVAKELRDGAGSGSEDYYGFIAARSADKKASKAALAAAYAQADSGIVRIVDDETVDGGKRGITRAIEKNKGLTPKRKKDVRNGRVKKRKKFEEKQKKLGSIRQIYKGESRGGYQGEMTGIKKGLVKSVKL